jgi:hypothetical protein
MPRPIPATIQRVRTRAGWKLIFTWRTLSSSARRRFGRYLLLGATGLLGGLVLLIWSLATRPLDEGGPLIGLFIMAEAMAGYLLIIGLNQARTRCQVEITADGVHLIEQQGLLRRVRRRSWLHVRKVVTHHLVHVEFQRNSRPTQTGALELVGHGAQTLWFGHGYPREWLLAVGDTLAAAGNVPHVEAPSPTKEPTRVQSFFQQDGEDEQAIDIESPPTDCLCRVEQKDGLFSVIAPALPLRQALETRTIGILLAALVGFACFAVYAVGHEGVGILAIIGPIAAVFVAGGLAVVAARLQHFGSMIFRLDDELLTVIEKPRFGGGRRQRLRRSDIAAIRAEEVDPNDGEASPMHLRIVHVNGQVMTFLRGRPPEELWWIAAVLRRRAAVPAVAGHSVTA